MMSFLLNVKLGLIFAREKFKYMHNECEDSNRLAEHPHQKKRAFKSYALNGTQKYASIFFRDQTKPCRKYIYIFL